MKKIVLNQKTALQFFSILCVMLFSNFGWGQVTQTFNTAGTSTWTCPVGVTTITVECWGGGASGGAGAAGKSGGGGGGGSYVTNTLTVVPGSTYTLTVGAGGIAGATTNATNWGLKGNNTQFSSGTTGTIGIVTVPVHANGGGPGGGGNTATNNGSGGVLGGVYGFNAPTAPGSGYPTDNSTPVIFTGGGGSGASGKVTSTSGPITVVSASSQGSGYTSVPTISFSGTGSGATVIALVNLITGNTGGTVSLGGNGTDGVAGVSGGAGGAGGGTGGGAGGASNTTSGGVGAVGQTPGGGGAGGYGATGSAKGGAGGTGQIKISYAAPITNYYYKGGDFNVLANWSITQDLLGAAPSSFIADFQNFNILSSATTINPWTVSGTASKIILGNPAVAAVTLTVANTFPITGTIDILAAASSESNSLVLQDTSQPTFGTLDNNSEVHLQGAYTYTTSTTFGKLIFDGTGSTTLSGNPIIKTSLQVPVAGRLTLSGTSTLYTVINANASVIINGYLKIGKLAGAFSYNVTTPGSGFGSIEFKDAVPNLTLGSSSTIEYARNNTTTTQSISTLPSGVSYAKLTISDGGIDCNKSFEGNVTVNNTFTLNQTASTLTGCGSLTLASGATIVRTAGSLDAAPTFGSTVNVTYNGATAISSSYEIPNAITSSTVLNNLTIATTALAVVTLASATNLNNKLSVTSGSLNSAGFLTLKSAECCTAYVGQLAAGAVTGNVTVERYIPAKRAWRALTTPVSTTTSIFTNWQEGGSGNTINGFDIWMPLGTNGVTDGGISNSMLSYNSTGNTWTGITNTTDASTMMNANGDRNKPFMAFVTGPYGTGNISAGFAATTLRAKGSLIIGQQTYTTIANKYTFIGNPYASPLSLSSMITNNNGSFEGNIWIWDANTTVANPVGIYNLYNSGTYTNVTSTPVAPTTEIQSGQAFFVRSTAGDSFIIQESNKGTTNSAANIVFRDAAPAQLLRVGLYKQINTEWSGRDGAMTVILPDADANQTPNKMANETENVAFTKNGLLFASEHHLPLIASDVLDVRVWNTTAGTNYKLKINTEQFTTTNLNATLVDSFTNSRTPLTLDGTAVEYPFAVSSEATSTGNRFRIVFENSTLGINNPKDNEITLYPNPISGDTFQVNLGTLGMGIYSYSICNALGQEVEKGSINNVAQNTNYAVKFKNNAAAGLYIMKVTGTDNTVFTAKLIKK